MFLEKIGLKACLTFFAVTKLKDDDLFVYLVVDMLDVLFLLVVCLI